MVWGLCPSSVRVAVISEPIEQIPFNSVLGCPGAEPGWKWTFLKKKSHFLIFSSA